jgi:hypothetical protein
MKQVQQFIGIIEREGDGYIALCPELDIASPQRLAPAPYPWRSVRDTPADVTGHPTMARGEDDAPHRRRGIPRGLCSGGAGAKMAL